MKYLLCLLAAGLMLWGCSGQETRAPMAPKEDTVVTGRDTDGYESNKNKMFKPNETLKPDKTATR